MIRNIWSKGNIWSKEFAAQPLSPEHKKTGPAGPVFLEHAFDSFSEHLN